MITLKLEEVEVKRVLEALYYEGRRRFWLMAENKQFPAACDNWKKEHQEIETLRFKVETQLKEEVRNA